MKRHVFAVLLFLALPAALLATGVVTGFVAIPDNDRVYVRWTSQNESTLIRYELYRQIDGASPVFLAAFAPQGNHRNYEYVDMSVGGLNRHLNPNEPPASLAAQRLTYTLKMLTASGALEVQTHVSFQTSATRRTWGSIKALFR